MFAVVAASDRSAPGSASVFASNGIDSMSATLRADSCRSASMCAVWCRRSVFERGLS